VAGGDHVSSLVPAAGRSATGRLLGAELERRLAHAIGAAEDLLGAGRGAVRADRLHELAELLASTGGGEHLTLISEHEEALERLRERFETRFEALERARGATSELRKVTSPGAMLERAPAALCGASNFRRAILSLVDRGRMVPEAAYFEGATAVAEAVVAELRTDPVRLEHPLIETELLRRRRATIVVDARVQPRVDRRLAKLMGWSSYAAAPLVVGPHVLGVLHADRGRETPLDVLDRDVLWEFSTALAQAYESASLVRTLRSEREQTRSFLDWLSARSGELTDAPIRLATVQRPPRAPLAPIELPLGRDDRAVFEGLLTRRELDVLRLLADGKTNKAIAEALVISDGTVKFHVNSLLRKLRVANRAEAVSRYLRLLGMRAP
jgi:LuxR family transcriptional regulator, regulator of acetate metabolism